MYLEIKGNLLDYYQTHYLVHQCNCKTTTSCGLAKTIFKKIPEANTYITDKARNPGEIDLIKPVINLYGQVYPGRANAVLDDSKEDRLRYFKKGLDAIYQTLENLEIINLAFPKGIGCGLAGGDWKIYESILKDFERNIAKVNILVVDFS